MALVYLDATDKIQSTKDGNFLINDDTVGVNRWVHVPDAEWRVLQHNNDNQIIDGKLVPNHVPDRPYWLDGKEYVLKHPDTLPEGATFEKPVDVTNAERIAEIKDLLMQNDLASIRPLRAINDGTATDFDRTKLAELEVQAQALRNELASL